MTKGQDTLTMTDTLRRAIVESGLSLREVARRSGIDDRIVSRFAKGERDMQGKTMDRLCAALGLRLTTKTGRHKG